VGAHEARFVEVIHDAATRRKRVKLRYFTAKRQDDTTREVDVYGYAWRRGVWLFAGHCHLRNSLRVFYVSRVREVRILKSKSSGPDYSIPRDFDIRSIADQQPWEYWVHAPVEVKVLFHAHPDLDVTPSLVAQQVPGARTEARPEGVLARVTARNADALVRHVFSTGLDAEVVAPASMRERARTLLASVAGGGEP
jgi:proteasome accessory factor B